MFPITAARARALSSWTVVDRPRIFTLWCCLDHLEWTKRTAAHKLAVLPRPSLAPSPIYDAMVDLKTERVEFQGRMERALLATTSIAEVDAIWRARAPMQGSSSSKDASMLLARSLAISRLANNRRELNRALGALASVLACKDGNENSFKTLALNHTMQCFFHDPRQVLALLRRAVGPNAKTFALALASHLHVELNEQSGYFIEKALAQYASTGRVARSGTHSTSANVVKVLAEMEAHEFPLSTCVCEELLCAAAETGEWEEALPALLMRALPEQMRISGVRYLGALYDAAMVRIRPQDCLALLGEMEERGVPRSEYHFIMAAAGLRRRALLDWTTTTSKGANIFRYVPQNASRAAHNRTHFGPSLSPFYIITIQQAYEAAASPGQAMHPRFALELIKAYASHTGQDPFGTSEQFFQDFIRDKLCAQLTRLDWEENAMARVVERLARNVQLHLAYDLARYMGKTRYPRNTSTNNAFLTLFIQHVRRQRGSNKPQQQQHAHIVLNAEFIVLQMCGENALPKLKHHLRTQRLSGADGELVRRPADGITRHAPDVTKFCQPDARTIYLLGALYHAAGMRQALLQLESSVEVRAWAKPLQDMAIQMVDSADDALALVGELQTTSTVDEDTIHWLVEALLRDAGRGDRLAEAVGNLVGFCRTYKLVPKTQTVRALAARANATSNNEELGRIKDLCEEFGVILT